MLRSYLRTLYSDNGSLTDVSLLLQKEGGGYTSPFTLGEDYLYIGQYFPFNNFFLWLETVSAQGTKLIVEVFDGTAWRPCVDTLDGTEGLKRSGVVQFVPDKQYPFSRVGDTSEVSSTFELRTLKIYNLFWIRVKAGTTAPDLTTKIKTITYAFCESSDLKKTDPEIDSFLTAWSTGKTNWLEQVVDASEQVVVDLKGAQLVLHPGQILMFDQVSLAARFKALEIIYGPLGESKDSMMKTVRAGYSKAINVKNFGIDVNQDATVEVAEVYMTQAVGVR